jgi:hypothetical protein
MPQMTTAFEPDLVSTMRWALDTASDRVPVTVTHACDQGEDGSADREFGAPRYQGRAAARGGGGGRRDGARAVGSGHVQLRCDGCT